MSDQRLCDGDTCGTPGCQIPYGYCHCGCGAKTRIAAKTYAAQRQHKGHPNRYLASHSAPKHPDYLEENRGYETPCWIWQGAHDWDGYGLVNRPAHRGNVHILYYKLHVAPVPKGLEIDHLCRVRDCVNPAHLQPKTHRENILIGESPTAKNSRKTHCIRGHELVPGNLYVQADGGRRCRTCQKAYMKAYHLKRKAKRAGGDPKTPPANAIPDQRRCTGTSS